MRTLVSDPLIIELPDGKVIEARPCSRKHREYFEAGFLVLSCSKCKMARVDGGA